MNHRTLALLLLFGAHLFSGCIAGHHASYSRFSAIDFREFTQAGFMITPEKYPGEYESIGVVSFVVFAEATEKRGNPGTYRWQYSYLDFQDSLRHFVDSTRRMGADAIVNFVTSDTSRTLGSVVIPGFYFRGFAIKRRR